LLLEEGEAKGQQCRALACFGAEGKGKLWFFLLLRERRPGSRRGRTPGTGLQVAAAFSFVAKGGRLRSDGGQGEGCQRKKKNQKGRGPVGFFWRRRVGYGSVREENW